MKGMKVRKKAKAKNIHHRTHENHGERQNMEKARRKVKSI